MSTTNIYRVIAVSRATGKENICYQGDKASIATSTYDDLKKRPMFMADFKIMLQKMRPVTVWESE
uniref:Uncharacterized protein n=1 Tax=Salmonella phage PMBT35 TaxID=3137287 RepID=A0AAU8BUM5_9VIRU